MTVRWGPLQAAGLVLPGDGSRYFRSEPPEIRPVGLPRHAEFRFTRYSPASATAMSSAAVRPSDGNVAMPTEMPIGTASRPSWTNV